MENQVKQRAYQLWEADGRPEGKDKQYWLAAEAEVTAPDGKPAKAPRKRVAKAK
ncbi:MAG: DUF2934 domain-containing protein [Candidatus Devosia phytovorans]|uniref:DUF2934 domain-containing protein n=1 Tax=Candidatus Devosia phytovorans TaxID=3121372 RepID=A0AAJ6B1A8_9HYPH|nr:DUF2934 domain-containing protein [Devosia sp.]WEK06082.1 MAG: DUF2934 domain-containing protein [Devosia sp.]